MRPFRTCIIVERIGTERVALGRSQQDVFVEDGFASTREVISLLRGQNVGAVDDFSADIVEPASGNAVVVEQFRFEFHFMVAHHDVMEDAGELRRAIIEQRITGE